MIFQSHRIAFEIIQNIGGTDYPMSMLYTDEVEAQKSADRLTANRALSNATFRVIRVSVTELPDDYDAEQEKTMDRIRTADEKANDSSYLDHPALY